VVVVLAQSYRSTLARSLGGRASQSALQGLRVAVWEEEDHGEVVPEDSVEIVPGFLEAVYMDDDVANVDRGAERMS
jgi:hypothetical protein